MNGSKSEARWQLRYLLIVLGLLLLLVSHVSVLLGDPWFVPDFLRLY
jgi:hypothetical protein